MLWKLGMTANSATIFVLSGSFDSNHFFLFHIQSSQPLERFLRRFWQRALSKLSLYPILTDHSARIILICKPEIERVVAIIAAKNKHGRIIMYNMCNIDKSGI